jgi:hypothetical protein
MDSELLQSFVRSGPTLDEEAEPSRLYPVQPKDKQGKDKRKDRSEDSPTPPPLWGRRKNVVIIEQRKARTIALAIDECYCDKDRAASVSFGYMDIKHELKQKQTAEKLKVRIMPDDTDAMAFLMLGMREIKNGNIESGVRFLSKVQRRVFVRFDSAVSTFYHF